MVSAASDSALFARARSRPAPGNVMGPDSVRNGWAVARVTEFLPPRRRTFAEARQLVYHDWYGKEGERLMEDLIERSKRATRVGRARTGPGGLDARRTPPLRLLAAP
jgi:hypothetical protein